MEIKKESKTIITLDDADRKTLLNIMGGLTTSKVDEQILRDKFYARL